MKKFIYNLITIISPFFIIIIIVGYVDFFKIWGYQGDYYEDNKVGLNRGMICTKTYNHYRKKEKFNSFIFGSSISQAYKCKEWIKFIDRNSRPFHFDASGEGILGISKKVGYIDELGDTIKNALIILDRTILKKTYYNEGHLFIPMPEVSKSSYFNYYFAFLKASLDPKFIIAYTDFSIFDKHRGYMGNLISKQKYKNTANYKNCDLWYGHDEHIRIDSLAFYQKLIDKGIFYKRPIKNKWICKVTNQEISQLQYIKKIFDKHNTNYKIVISPKYDQIPIEKEQLRLLFKIFGEENIYNFSGKNIYTDKISNFYEAGHYRPVVANDIMKKIYGKK